MNQRLSFVIVSLLAAAGVWVIAARRAAKSDQELTRLEGKVASLANRLSRAQSELDQLPRPSEAGTTVIRVEAPARADASATAGERPAATETAAAEPPREPSTAEDQRAFVAATFTQQTVDPAWSRQATNEAQELFGPLTGQDTALRSVECRSSICRVELAQSSEQEAKRVAGQLMNHRSRWKGAISAAIDSTDPSGRVNYVVYLARGDMPTLD